MFVPQDVLFVPLSSNRPKIVPQGAPSHSLSASCECIMSHTSRCLLEQPRWITHSINTHTTESLNCRHFTHDHWAFVWLILSAKWQKPCVFCHWAAVNTDQRRALLQHAAFHSNTKWNMLDPRCCGKRTHDTNWSSIIQFTIQSADRIKNFVLCSTAIKTWLQISYNL